MPDKHRKVQEHHSLPEIKAEIKTPPSSGGMTDWGPIFSWIKSLFNTKRKK